MLVAVNGAQSNGLRFMVGDIPDSIAITPNKMALLVGQTQPLIVVDSTGTPISGGVSRQISDATIGTISTDNPASFTASTVGQATITASYQGLTAQAILNIYMGDTLPTGTEMWSLDAPSSTYLAYILQATPSFEGAVDLIAVQDDSTFLGLTASGSVVWSAAVPWYGVPVLLNHIRNVPIKPH